MSFKDKIKNFFNTEEYEYEYVEQHEDHQAKDEQIKPSNVVNLSAIQQPNAKVMLCEPRSYNEVQEIADYLLNKRSVIINLNRLDSMQAKKIVDFLSGTVYAIKGDIQKLDVATFICTPENIEVTGTISNLAYIEDEFKKDW